MSRIQLASLALTSAVAVVGLSAPAQAATIKPASSYVLYGAYNWPDQCQSIGYAGEQAGQWSSYYCDTIDPASADGPGLYDLYVLYS